MEESMVNNNGDASTDAEPISSAEERQEERTRKELLAKAKQQLAAVTDEFQRGLKSVKSPQRRQRMTMAYVQLMQKTLAKARQSLDKYQTKRQTTTQVDQIDNMPQD
jgi:molecular chaperone GrpE (heat shock protein)